jgi:tRNA(Ile)-lysidine synthase
VYEIIKDFGFTAHQTDECIALLKSETGKYIQSPTHRIIRNRNWLIISPNQPKEAENILLEGEGKTLFFGGSLEIKTLQQTTNHKLQTTSNIGELDAGKIKFPLLLRKWKQGDYFYPLGMQKKKKLSRFFIDQKLSLTQKEKAWVIEMNKKIIWVVGMRIDDRFKITDATKEILQITLVNTK